MAFMVPVVRKNWELYPTRSRTTSTCSNASTGSSVSRSSGGSRSAGGSLSTSPQNKGIEFARRHVRFSRSVSEDSSSGGQSRSSSDSSPTLTTTAKNNSYNSEQQPRTGSLRAIRRSTGQIETKTPKMNEGLRKNASANDTKKLSSSASPQHESAAMMTSSFGSVSKFHTKLVDKLKRKLRIGDHNHHHHMHHDIDSESVSGDESVVVRAST